MCGFAKKYPKDFSDALKFFQYTCHRLSLKGYYQSIPVISTQFLNFKLKTLPLQINSVLWFRDTTSPYGSSKIAKTLLSYFYWDRAFLHNYKSTRNNWQQFLKLIMCDCRCMELSKSDIERRKTRMIYNCLRVNKKSTIVLSFE